MENCAVPDVSAGLDGCFHVRVGMNNAIILKITPCLYHDPTHITAKRCPRTDITTWANNNVANENRGGMNERCRIHYRDDTVDGIDVRHRNRLVRRGVPLRGNDK